MNNFLKPLKYGSLLDKNNFTLFLKMCQEAGLPHQSMEELPTLDKLREMSDLSEYEFKNSCFSFYIAIEEDDWDPSIEICAICAAMKAYHKAWNPTTKKWVEWDDSRGQDGN